MTTLELIGFVLLGIAVVILEIAILALARRVSTIEKKLRGK
jgi:hypothetical protein